MRSVSSFLIPLMRRCRSVSANTAISRRDASWTWRLSLLLVLAAACRDPLRPVGALTTIAPTAYEVTVQVEPGASPDRHVIRVRWRSGESAAPLGGFRATLLLPDGVTVRGDVANQESARGDLLRVLHTQGARVMATGAATQGFVLGDLFVVEVQATAAQLRGVRLDLQDVVDQSGGNRRSAVRVVERLP